MKVRDDYHLYFYDNFSFNSVGIENVEDLKNDLQQALERVTL